MVNVQNASERGRIRASLTVQSKAAMETAGAAVALECAKHVEELEKCKKLAS
jgi:hypothetical protein